MIRSAKPKAWKVSTLRAWMPSAWPMASRPARRSTMRVVMLGNWESCAAASMPAGPVPTMSTSTSSGSSAGPVDADAGGGLDPRVTGYVTVVVELHGLSSLRCVAD